MIEFIHDFTENGLKLQATHWINDRKDICVICIHGMSGNIIDNYFAHVWGRKMVMTKVLGMMY